MTSNVRYGVTVFSTVSGNIINLFDRCRPEPLSSGSCILSDRAFQCDSLSANVILQINESFPRLPLHSHMPWRRLLNTTQHSSGFHLDTHFCFPIPFLKSHTDIKSNPGLDLWSTKDGRVADVCCGNWAQTNIILGLLMHTKHLRQFS